MYDRYADALRRLDAGLNLAIENHVLDPIDFDRWAELSPGLTLDVEHLWKFTLKDGPMSLLLAQLERFLERHSRKLQHVHLLGYHPGGEEHQPVHFHPELVTEVFSRLAAYGYSNLVVSEADLPFQTHDLLSADVELFNR